MPHYIQQQDKQENRPRSSFDCLMYVHEAGDTGYREQEFKRLNCNGLVAQYEQRKLKADRQSAVAILQKALTNNC